MLKCAVEVLIIIIIFVIIITWVMWFRIVHLNVCSIWEYVTAFFARLQFTTVLLWCSDHYHHHHHHHHHHHRYPEHHHHHHQYYHNHFIRTTVKINVTSQNVRFWVKPQFFKLGYLTLSVPWWRHSQIWHQTVQILSDISTRIFLSFSLKTFP